MGGAETAASAPPRKPPQGSAELAEQIQHFRRDILAHRLLICGAKCLSDFGLAAPFAARAGYFLILDRLRLIGPAPPVLVAFEGQISVPSRPTPRPLAL
jgi:hypothetical protein